MVSVIIIVLMFTTILSSQYGVLSDIQKPADFQGNPITHPPNYSFDGDWLLKARQEFHAKASESDDEKKTPVIGKKPSNTKKVNNNKQAVIASTSNPVDTTVKNEDNTTSNPVDTTVKNEDNTTSNPVDTTVKNEDNSTQEPNKTSKCNTNTLCIIIATSVFVYTAFDLY